MLYAGMLFFSLAIVSGLYAFADIATAPAAASPTPANARVTIRDAVVFVGVIG